MNPRFVLPPHPKTGSHIRRQDLPVYEEMGGYLAQRKFNGTHGVIWIGGNKVSIWDRRGVPLSLYKLNESMKRCLLGLGCDPSKESIFTGEILHTKAKSERTGEQEAKDTIVLFDVIVHDNEPLTRMNQVDRLKLLSDICGNPSKLEGPKFFGATSRALVVSEYADSEIDVAHLWLAETFMEDFQYHYDECCYDQLDKNGYDKYKEIEGLVLRQRDSRLQFKQGDIGDVDWIIRCRKDRLQIKSSV